MGYLNPDEKWPRHSRPQAAAALADARAAGWFFRESSDHAFGRTACSPDANSDRCVVIVYSTSGPADGSETAKHIRRALRNCPHGEPDEELTSEISSDEALTRLSHLLDACDALEARAATLERLEVALDDDDLDAFEAADIELVDVDNEAAQMISTLGFHTDPWPPPDGIRELLTDALRQVSDLDPDDLDRDVLERLENLRARYEV